MNFAHETIYLLACHFVKCWLVLNFFTSSLSSKSVSVSLLKTPPYFRFVATLSCDLLLIMTSVSDCRFFSDINMSRGTVATHECWWEFKLSILQIYCWVCQSKHWKSVNNDRVTSMRLLSSFLEHIVDFVYRVSCTGLLISLFFIQWHFIIAQSKMNWF